MIGRFTEKQKQYLKKSILLEGRKLFKTYGYAKTSIQDITNKVGIAQGSFYSFFSSKADLYFAILEKEEEEIRQYFLKESLRPNETNEQFLARMLLQMTRFIDTNPLLHELFFENKLQEMMNDLSRTIIDSHIKNDELNLLPLINHWRSMGINFRVEPSLIASLLRAILLLSIHKEQIGTGEFHKTSKFIIEAVVEKMIGDDQ